MLGDDRPLDWKWVEGEMTGRIWHEGKEIVGGGLSIKTPAEKPSGHATCLRSCVNTTGDLKRMDAACYNSSIPPGPF